MKCWAYIGNNFKLRHQPQLQALDKRDRAPEHLLSMLHVLSQSHTSFFEFIRAYALLVNLFSGSVPAYFFRHIFSGKTLNLRL